MPRYRDYICNTCLTTHGTKTRDGRRISFTNVDISGGFVSLIEGDTKSGEVNTCYVNGIRCYASEARFGGIVFQPDPDSVAHTLT